MPELMPDIGRRYKDQNAGRWPTSPMEPAIRAVVHLQPNFEFSSLEIITDRYALACLLQLAVRLNNPIKEPDGKKNKENDRNGNFNFSAQVVDGTVIFVPNDRQTVEEIKLFRGFPLDFKKKYFEYPEDLQDTVSHQRIITYRLGDLKIMVAPPCGWLHPGRIT